MSLPTYEEATARPDPWVIVAPQVPSNTLTNLCLVSKHFYDIFMPLLWFEPTKLLLSRPKPFRMCCLPKSHAFANHIPVAYDQFARKVWKARRHVRSHVTALDFRKLGPVNFLAREIDLELTLRGRDGNLIFEWFGLLGLCFPSLKFFLVDGTGDANPIVRLSKEIAGAPLPTENGPSSRVGRFNEVMGGMADGQYEMMAAGPERGDSMSSESTFRPVLLSATGCSQLFIPMFISTKESAVNLLYLDISWTKQKPEDLLILAMPPQLKILKMQGLSLRTRDISGLLYKLKLRLFSLDFAYNDLADEVIPLLLANNFLPSLEEQPNTLPRIDGDQSIHPGRYLEDAPAYRERADPLEEQETAMAEGRIHLRADNVDGVFSHLLENEHMKFIRGPHWLPPAGDSIMQQTGLTHLYLSNNRLTSYALEVLLSGTNRLQLLDFGSAEQPRHQVGSKYKSVLAYNQADTLKLLKPSISQRLESLRVHHSVVTQTPTLFAIGEFYLSEERAVFLAEEEFATKNVLFSPPSDFLPELNPRIKSLTLTHVPRKSLGLVIDRLVKLISLAAMQEVIIAGASPADPRRGAQMLPGLRYLCLEFAPPAKVLKPSKDGPSVSGDVDADTFMAESGKDFSFFDETQSPQSATKDFSFFDDDERPLERTSSISSETASKKMKIENLELHDVKEAIMAYRQSTKEAYEAERERLSSAGELALPGPPHYYWTGQLELVDESSSQVSDLKRRLLEAMGGGEPVRTFHPGLI
jgi:hypothetical protein